MSADSDDAELVTRAEALLLDLARRLEQRAGASIDDPIASDEVFVLAGQLDAVLRASSARMQQIRDAIDRASRAG